MTKKQKRQSYEKRSSPYFHANYRKRTNANIPITGSVDASLWSQAREKTNGKSREAQELNYNIQFIRSRILQIYHDWAVNTKPISAQIIKDIYLGNDKDEEKGKTLVEVHSEHNE